MTATDTLSRLTNAAIQDDLIPRRKGASGPNDFYVPDNRPDVIQLARYSEQAERYDEMLLCMRKAVKLSPELTSEERNLLLTAYKCALNPRRTSWRVLGSIESREHDKGSSEHLPMLAMFRKQIESEIMSLCDDLIQLLDAFLIPAVQTVEGRVFFLKMKADYHRYCTEIVNNEAHKRAAQETYEKASQHAQSLPSTHPIRLGLALNVSVFHYEILKQREVAAQMARQAYEDAATEVDALDDDAYRETQLTLELLRDNLNMWAEETQ